MTEKNETNIETLEDLKQATASVLAETVKEIAARAIKPELAPFKEKIEKAIGYLEGLIDDLSKLKSKQDTENAENQKVHKEVVDKLSGLEGNLDTLKKASDSIREILERQKTDLLKDLSDLKSQQDNEKSENQAAHKEILDKLSKLDGLDAQIKEAKDSLAKAIGDIISQQDAERSENQTARSSFETQLKEIADKLNMLEGNLGSLDNASEGLGVLTST